MGATHHNGLSVFGSGFCIGAGGNISGLFGATPSDRSGARDSFMGPAGVDGLVRFDAGIINVSAAIVRTSTRLSSIAIVVAAFTPAQVVTSAILAVGWSGGAFDVRSVATSAQVAWMALGR